MSEELKNIPPKEGDLYKTINVFGKSFKLYYGYYDERDRYSKYGKLMEIYPDFINNPIYTDDGYPFVTAIQKVCENYTQIKDTTNRCVDCIHYQKGVELFGLCMCKERIKNNNIMDK